MDIADQFTALSVASAIHMAPETIDADAHLAQAASRITAAAGVGLLVKQGSDVIGIVSAQDCARALAAGIAHSEPVSRVMCRDIMSVAADTTFDDALDVLLAHGASHLLVEDDQGKAIGLLSERDLLRQYAGERVRLRSTESARQGDVLDTDRFYSIVNRLPQRIFIKDLASAYVACNKAFADDLGAEPDDVIGKNDFDFYPHEIAAQYRADDSRVMAERTSISVEEDFVTADGTHLLVQTSKAPLIDQNGQVKGLIGIYADITERKQMDAEMARHNWTLRAISLSDKALVYAQTEQAMLEGVCAALTSEGRYLLAWVGWAEDDEVHSVSVRACAGAAAAYTDGLRVTWAEGPFGNGPTGRAIRTGMSQIGNSIHVSPDFAPWWERAGRYGIQSVAGIPLKLDGRVAGAITVYSSDPKAFGPEEVQLFEELADTVAYGVQSRRTHAAYERSLEDIARQANKLEKALEDSLAGIAAVLEQRDPYTAGHQQHVAELAVKIARELRLDEERVRALYLSGIVHDLGKIQIPAEILTKPARLNAAEFALVKQHPETGYNILKKIDFPWPIAEIIREHHEYLDGTGYPHGLTGDAILYEARILTVADIVESMSSDRPYRPALGIPEAIQEIMRMRGTKLDPTVVDACVALLRRGDFVPHMLHVEVGPD